MPDEQLEAQEPVVEAVEPDYKALLEAEKAARAELEAKLQRQGADYSALRGTVRSQTLRDQEWAKRFDTLERQVATVAKAGGDDVAQEALKLQQEGEAARQQTAFDSEWATLHEELKSVLIVDEKPVMDLAAAPELAEVRRLYNEARQGQGLTGEARLRMLERATRLAERAMREQRGKIAEPAVQPAAAPPPAAPPRARVPAMDTGVAAGGAVISDEDYLKEYGKSSMPFGKPPDHTRVRKFLDKR